MSAQSSSHPTSTHDAGPVLRQHPEAIAVAGMGCRWPGGVSRPQDLWDLLMQKRSGYMDFPDSKMRVEGFYHPDAHRQGGITTKGGFFLQSDPHDFDHSFFGISPAEATSMDPTQRKILEVTYEAFEDAGVPWADFSGSNTGVFVGNFNTDYCSLQARDLDSVQPYATTGSAPSILSNRVNFVFNLLGPSVTMDTACSSSMYALHLAIQSLRNRDCDAAIVIGSNLILSPDAQIMSTKLGVLSPTSQCHTFDASADGYARAEGIGALYLRRAHDVLDARQRLRAVIRGTAINSNGRGAGITFPSANAQEAVIKRAFVDAGNLDPSLTGYFECHGTGTPVGDPVEVEAVGRVFAPHRADSRLPIGSIKPNIGHTESASGIASLMKVILALEHGVIPPTIGVQTLNPNIDFQAAQVEVVTDARPWPVSAVRRASVNSFGFGGANAHCILDSVDSFVRELRSGHQSASYNPPDHPQEQLNEKIVDFPIMQNGSTSGDSFSSTSSPAELQGGPQDAKQEIQVQQNSQPGDFHVARTVCGIDEPLITVPKQSLIPFSAQSEASLWANIRMLSLSAADVPCQHVVRALSVNRSRFNWRGFAVGSSLPSVSDSEQPSGVTVSKCSSAQVAAIGFIFTGQGAQWVGMGARLLQQTEIFRESISFLDASLRQLPTPPDWKISDEILKPPENSRVNEPEFAQTITTAIQVAVLDVLRYWGIQPAIVVGHSSGEIAAAYAAGRHSAATAITVAYLRGQAVKSSRRDGRMLAVGCSSTVAAAYVERFNDSLQIAAVNSANSVTVSGDTEAILALQKEFTADGYTTKVLRTNAQAYHSFHMKDVGPAYEESIRQAMDHLPPHLTKRPDPATVPIWYSSVSLSYDSKSFCPDPSYWRQNLESPVQFDAAVSAMASAEFLRPDLLIEIGPNPALRGPLAHTREHRRRLGLSQLPMCLPSLKFREDSFKNMLQLAGNLFLANAPVDLGKVNMLPAVDEHSPDFDQNFVGTELPPYQWNYGPALSYESRINRELRLRPSIRHEILGSRVLGSSQDCPSWRNVLRCKDVPWLMDHMLIPEVVFPAAGYLCLAIEALSQVSQHQIDSIGYSFRNVSIKSPLRLPENDRGIETVFDMHPQGLFNGSSRRWYQFSASSWNSYSDSWTQHCCGQISVEPKPRFEANLAPDNLVPIEADGWYEAFRNKGLGYGPRFRGLSELKALSTLQTATALVSLSAAGPPGHDEGYLIHPSAIDAAFQLGLIAAHNGRATSLDRAFVPIGIDGLTIWPSQELSVHAVATAEFKGLRSLHSSIQLFDHHGVTVVDIQSLRTIEYAGQLPNDKDSMIARDPFSRLVWKPDIDYVSQKQADDLFPPPVAPDDFIPAMQKLDILADCIVLQAQALLRQKSAPPAFQNFQQWVEKRAGSIFNGDSQLNCTEISSSEAREATMNRLFVQTSDLIESKLLARLFKSLPTIMEGERSALDVASEDDLLTAVYETGYLRSAGYTQLGRILDLISHKDPHAKILEIGAGTGGATRKALTTLQGDTTFARYQSYHFTDVSSSFLSTAERNFSSYSGLEYKTLDISRDPQSQGFSEMYDLVLASQCLHATANIVETLRHVRSTLRPGGRLVFLEGIRNNPFINLTFGLFPDWWAGSEIDGRIDGAYLTRDQWAMALKSSGFSGIDIELKDLSPPHTFCSTMMAHAIDPIITSLPREVSDPAVISIVVHDGLYPSIAHQLMKAFAEVGKSGICVPLSHVQHSRNQRIISLVDLHESPFMLAASDHFPQVQEMIVAARSIVWISGSHLEGATRPSAGLAHGMFPTIGIELPTLRYMTIDVECSDDKVPGSTIDTIVSLEERLHRSTLDAVPARIDNQYTLGSTGALISRVAPHMPLNAWFREQAQRVAATSPKALHSLPPVRLRFSQPGVIDSYFFEQTTRFFEALADDEVEIETRAVGLSLRDVAVATGRFDTDDLGYSCSGLVRRVGKLVTELACGDRVWGFASSDYGNFIRGRSTNFRRLLDSQTFAEGSSLAMPYCAAQYALVHLARLMPRETILIESGTGTLGLAAIRIAQCIGAEIFVTVSTDRKRAFLQQEFGIATDHVFESRKQVSLEASEEGIAFDVILCCSSGDHMHDIWRNIAPFGRFIDVGRKDVLDGAQLAMEVFQRNATFSSFDLGDVFRDRPQIGDRLLSEISELFQSGALRGTERVTTYDISHIGEAFLHFLRADRIGPVSVTYEDPESLLKVGPLPARVKFDPDASYLLVGCLGGLGISISNWMVKCGARRLVYLSRSGVKDAQTEAVLSSFRAQSVAVEVVSGDVSVLSDVEVAVARCLQGSQLKGIVQAAVDLADNLFETTTSATFQRALRPKCIGSVNLDQATRACPLDFFVMTSSIVGIAGNPTQSAYSAANAFQDYFARWRRAQGRCATSLLIGLILEAGVAVSQPHFVSSLHRAGSYGTSLADFLRLAEAAFLPKETDTLNDPSDANLVIGFEPSMLMKTFTVGEESNFHWSNNTKLSHTLQAVKNLILAKSSSRNIEKIPQSGLDLSRPEDIPDSIRGMMAKRLSQLLFVAEEEIDFSRSLSDYGVDSMVAAEVRNWLFKSFGLEVSFLELPDPKTKISSLVDRATKIVRKDTQRSDSGVDTKPEPWSLARVLKEDP